MDVTRVKNLKDHIGQIIMSAVLQGVQIGNEKNISVRMDLTNHVVDAANNEIYKLIINEINKQIEITRRNGDAVVSRGSGSGSEKPLPPRF